MKIKLTTLTPVHIGTGNRYTRFECIVRGNNIFRVSFDKIIEIYGEEKVQEIINKIESGDINVMDNLDENKVSKYKIINKSNCIPKEIKEQIKTDLFLPYIPGSSLKGSIRSALLWKYVIENDDLVNKMILTLNKEINTVNDKKKVLNNFINRIFCFGKKIEPQNDIMKFVMISDFMPLSNDILVVEKVNGYSLKKSERLENWTNIRRRQTPLITFVEAIKEGSILYGDISLSTQLLKVVNQKDIELKEKLKIIGLKENEIEDKNLEEIESKMVKFIQTTLKEFNRWCIKKELELVNLAKNKFDFSPSLQSIKETNENKNLIRTGFGIGTIYQTLIKVVEEKDKELFNKIRKKYKLGRYFDRDVPYPKSIEFTQDYKPLGWCEISEVEK